MEVAMADIVGLILAASLMVYLLLAWHIITALTRLTRYSTLAVALYFAIAAGWVYGLVLLSAI